MSIRQRLSEDRRGIILRTLDEAGSMRLADRTLRSVLGDFGHTIGMDELRTDLDWLDTQGLIRIDRIPDGSGGVNLLAQLLDAGSDVARGVLHPGIARQAPKQ